MYTQQTPVTTTSMKSNMKRRPCPKTSRNFVFTSKREEGAEKTATIVKGFTGTSDDLQELARSLKNKCATGGSSKEGEIILQGDVRDKVVDFLTSEGKKKKKAGG